MLIQMIMMIMEQLLNQVLLLQLVYNWMDNCLLKVDDSDDDEKKLTSRSSPRLVDHLLVNTFNLHLIYGCR